MRLLMIAFAFALSACAIGPQQGGWTSSQDAQPFETAVAACQQTSAGSADYFTVCMAGRGWTKQPR
jgi:hypothetical protein